MPAPYRINAPNRPRRNGDPDRLQRRKTRATRHWDPAVQSVSECMYSRFELPDRRSSAHHKRSRRAADRFGWQKMRTAAVNPRPHRKTVPMENNTARAEMRTVQSRSETIFFDRPSPGPPRRLLSCQDLERGRTATDSCRKATHRYDGERRREAPTGVLRPPTARHQRHIWTPAVSGDGERFAETSPIDQCFAERAAPEPSRGAH